MELEERRTSLQILLQTTANLPEEQVHFQPQGDVSMSWPAIVYSRARDSVDHADNVPYRRAVAYTVTVIHPDPDNDIRTRIAALPYCSFNRWYANDGLNHDVYTLFF